MLQSIRFHLLLFGLAAVAHAGEPVHFSREILPILSENCLSCHGQDEKNRKADLRLDTRGGATAVHDGVAAIVPGKPDQSELLAEVVEDFWRNHVYPASGAWLGAVRAWQPGPGRGRGNSWRRETPAPRPCTSAC